MRARLAALAALLSLAFVYLVYPYFTLYQIEAAVRHGDPVSLSRLVNWPAVREGIKEDICDLVMEQPQQAAAAGQLPPFGASFVRGVAGSAVDHSITAESLVAVTHSTNPAGVGQVLPKSDPTVRWAFFSSLTQFTVQLAAPEQVEPIKVLMELRHARWQVVRVWIPAEMLGRSGLRA